MTREEPDPINAKQQQFRPWTPLYRLTTLSGRGRGTLGPAAASIRFEGERLMIGKVVRMLVGRSIARKRGFSGAAGAAVALLAPVILKKAGGVIAKRRAAKKVRREEQRAPKYIDKIG